MALQVHIESIRCSVEAVASMQEWNLPVISGVVTIYLVRAYREQERSEIQIALSGGWTNSVENIIGGDMLLVRD